MPNVYIDTDTTSTSRDGSTTDPYNSWDEAWEAEDANIVAGETWNFYFRGTTVDNTSVVIDGLPTSGSPVTLNFYPWHKEFGAEGIADDGWYRGNETWSTSHYRLYVTGTGSGDFHNILWDNGSNQAHQIIIQGLQLGMAGTGRGRILTSQGVDNNSALLAFRQCRFADDTNPSVQGPRVWRGNASGTDSTHGFEMTNCLLDTDKDELMSVININDVGSNDTATVYNNTYVTRQASGEDFIDDVNGWAVTAKNNALYGDALSGGVKIDVTSAGTGGADTVDYNASNNGAADQGTNGFACVAADFRDFANSDLRPATSQTNAWGTGGLTNGDDSNVPTVDIRGFPRNTGTGENTAIGAFALEDEGNRIYIDTDNTAGGRVGTVANPYNSWNEAWEAEDANIAAGDVWNFYFRGTTEDTATTTIDGLPTTGAGVTLNFYPWHTEFLAESDADDGWYRGNNRWSTSHYRLNMSGVSEQIAVVVDFTSDTIAHRVNIQGLQLGIDNAQTTPQIINFRKGHGGNGTTLDVHQCRFLMAGTGTNPRMIRGAQGSSTTDSGGRANVKSTNCLFTYTGGAQNCSTYNFNHTLDTPYNKAAEVCNNTVVYVAGGEDFIDDVRGWECTVINNVADATAGNQVKMDLTATGGADFVGTTATVNATDRGNGGFAISKSGDFVDHAGGDYRPAVSQTNAWGTGGTTNADNPLIPTVDIRGNARNTGSGENTAIGCFAAAGEGSGDTNVNTNLETLTLTEQSASIGYDVEVTTNLETLTLTELPATVALGVNVQASTATLSLTEQQASIALNVNVDAATAVLALTEQQATIEIVGNDVDVQANTAALTLTEQTADIVYDVDVVCTTAALSLTTYTALVQTGPAPSGGGARMVKFIGYPLFGT